MAPPLTAGILVVFSLLDIGVLWYSSINEYVITIHETSMQNNLFKLVIDQYVVLNCMKSNYYKCSVFLISPHILNFMHTWVSKFEMEMNHAYYQIFSCFIDALKSSFFQKATIGIISYTLGVWLFTQGKQCSFILELVKGVWSGL